MARTMLPKLLSRVRPTMWVTAERAFAELFFLLLFAIQAPILGPSAFGLVTAVMVFVAFWEGVPGHAITEALLSIRQIEERHFTDRDDDRGGAVSAVWRGYLWICRTASEGLRHCRACLDHAGNGDPAAHPCLLDRTPRGRATRDAVSINHAAHNREFDGGRCHRARARADGRGRLGAGLAGDRAADRRGGRALACRPHSARVCRVAPAFSRGRELRCR